MRRFFKTVSILLLCGTLCCPVVEGRGRNNGQGGASQSHQSSQQAPQRGQSHGNQRPGSNGNNAGPQGNQRPGSNGNQNNRPGGQQNQRPGNNGGAQGNHRPGNNGNNGAPQGNQRPGNNGNQNNRPGGQQNPRPGNYPGNRPPSSNPGPATPPPSGGHGHAPHPGHGTPPPPTPGHGHHSNFGYGYPHRPNLPPPAPWQRPTPPPPGYRPYSGPSISTILGVALGTTIYYALDNLSSRGFNVIGYGNNAIYLHNVNQLGMNWPDATLYYVNGQLAASECVYTQGYYDMGRYFQAYGLLASTYGYPTSTSNYGQGGQSASWWSPTGQFITLTFAPAQNYDGYIRYYTTLSFGN